jgi:hypothetical protein
MSYCVSLLSTHLESESPSNLSALCQISAYNASLGYHWNGLPRMTYVKRLDNRLPNKVIQS